MLKINKNSYGWYAWFESVKPIRYFSKEGWRNHMGPEKSYFVSKTECERALLDSADSRRKFYELAIGEEFSYDMGKYKKIYEVLWTNGELFNAVHLGDRRIYQINPHVIVDT